MDGQLTNAGKSWAISLQQLAKRALGQERAGQLWQKYHAALPVDYQTLVPPRYALKDWLHLEQLNSETLRGVSLLKPYQGIGYYRLHFYSLQAQFLDSYMPILENLHLRVLDQVQFPVTTRGNTLYIRSFTIKTATSKCLSLKRVHRQLLTTIDVTQAGKTDNDALNKLLVLTGMGWQAIDALRAYRNYYLQLGHHTSRASVHHALINNPSVALGLYNYFEARFRPDPEWADTLTREEQALFPLRLQLLDSMALVVDLNDDRILRTLFNLIDATMRCNFHQRLAQDDYFIAFKINSLGVIDMPAPKPHYEVYVHSVAMEGIHLRGGKIARGGIRWSDRPDDFRTEILGLMQTQISKNALIVPTGAKGGFIVKKHNALPDMKAAGKQAYLTLMRGLLDLTDNYRDNSVVRPQQLVCYDDADPYLVVAADKGTATFSDSANQVSAAYQFWLGDAFASGGSLGYDHKALGITARGAWECVQRHFRELGQDIQNSDFTVVGIGSMDGDVFGNGLLLSPCIRLLAAFSGQHIFIDPNPSTGNAPFNERKRLFALAGSSWSDYDRSLLSEGGGVYLRSAKDIPIAPELKKWLGIRYKTLDGEALIRYLLVAPVDLLWLGGIGTYVKASAEKHEEVGDRGNDNVRVDANSLNARVVGEGANLGFTQAARIEYGLRGGRINTDAVDNSAGVDTSDHEVNLKILLTQLHRQQRIADYQPLFISMTAAVCQQVLANNYAQSLCLSLDSLRSANQCGLFLQLAERLESSGFLDRAVEDFPPNKAILARVGQILTRPELAVLMAASKMYLTVQLQNLMALLHDECCDCYLRAYFPEQLRAQYPEALSAHPLAGEIKATLVSNKLINQAGCSFLSLDSDNGQTGLLDLVGCYLTFDRVLEADALRHAIYALDNKIAADTQYQCLLQLEKTLFGFCRWALTHKQKIRPLAQTIDGYQQHLQSFAQYFKQLASPSLKGQQARHQQAGVPEELALRLVFIDSLNDFPLIVALATSTASDFVTAFKLFNDISQHLGLPEVLGQLTKITPHDYWEQKVSTDLQADIKHCIGLLLGRIVLSGSSSCADYFKLPSEQPKLDRYRRLYQEMGAVLPMSLMPFIALAKELEKLLG